MNPTAKLDPQARAALEQAARVPGPDLHTLELSEARRRYRALRLALAGAVPKVHEARDVTVAGTLSARLYRPLSAGPGGAARGGGCIVYFHGGGWTWGDLDTHDAVCRGMANHARCTVLSVAYRLAPEHPFPAAFDDAVASVRWAAANAAVLGADPGRIAVAGDSAGGNLAAAVALALRGEPHAPAMQILVYPLTDQLAQGGSRDAYAEGCGLTRAAVEWHRAAYLGAQDGRDWRASPLRAKDLSGAPPAYIVTAGFDPYRDEALSYAERLRQAGVKVGYECFEGQVHGFLTMGTMAAAHHALYRIGQALRPLAVPGVESPR